MVGELCKLSCERCGNGMVNVAESYDNGTVLPPPTPPPDWCSLEAPCGVGGSCSANLHSAGAGAYTCDCNQGYEFTHDTCVSLVELLCEGEDGQSGCPGWAAGGECDANTGYMLSSCCASCQGALRSMLDWIFLTHRLTCCRFACIRNFSRFLRNQPVWSGWWVQQRWGRYLHV